MATPGLRPLLNDRVIGKRLAASRLDGMISGYLCKVYI